jgi:ribose transport system ATP-binding protein
MAHPPVHLRMVGITKRFPGVIALAGVGLDLRGGEVLSLMGENGAGKSTLMKVLGGAYPPDEGTIEIDGQPVVFRGVSDSKARGIALIHQELMLAPNVDIAGNIFMGNEKRLGGRFGPMDRRGMRKAAAALLQRVGLNLSPATPVSRLTAGQMQMVEIAKALSADARILIMDEPTSSLTAGESEQLFKIIAQLKAEGLGIVYISHRMEEVVRLSDRITVMRDGRYIGDLSRAEATQDKIVSMMVGRSFTTRYPERPATEPGIDQPPVLAVENVVVPGATEGVTFAARRGEILGFAGLVGAGRTELMQVLFGVDPALAGRMTLNGEAYAPRTPRGAIDAGVYLAPEDRKRHGLVLPMSVAQNTSLPDIGNYPPAGWLNRAAERRVAEAEVKRMRIKTPDVGRRVVNLSGGNQQKVVLGKWLAMKPKVLILDEPTRGIDVGAKAEIYRTMAELAAGGLTILMVSSDMEEVIGMSDRVAVMHERRLRAVLPRSQATGATIGSLMTGQAVAGAAPSAAAAAVSTVVTAHALEPAERGPHGASHPSNPDYLEGRETPQ